MFTPPLAAPTTFATINNYENLLIDQGSSWTIEFTLAQSYPINSTLRFIFPQGFQSLQIQCSVEGLSDTTIRTRILPQLNVYDCLNLNKVLAGSQKVVLSGLVNPDHEMSLGPGDIEIHVLRPNNRVVVEIIPMSSSITILHKDMNACVLVPNKYRNNTATYTF